VGGSKAGGAPVPVTLRMAHVSSDLFVSAPAAAEFIRRVATLSGGQIQIQVIDQVGGFAADNEVHRASAAFQKISACPDSSQPRCCHASMVEVSAR